ncbi:MAG TPA: sialidase family protein [Candidatus Sumerlaeota bacterium]|nr:sialidase family protein [Candidatus Sumerlaeota bacterium]HPK01468.1 sialidase family protein [Candidatus Sumerlaeota bacterium]
MSKPFRLRVMCLALAWLTAGPRPALSAEDDKPWVAPGFTDLELDHAGPFVTLDDGSLLQFATTGPFGSFTPSVLRVSTDRGKTWSEGTPILRDGPAPATLVDLALRTSDGTLVVIYCDYQNEKWNWDEERGEATIAQLDTWSARSLDNGKTWIDRQLISPGWNGAPIDIIETAEGAIVTPVMLLIEDPGRHRHGFRNFVSTDQGQTWRKGNIIDLGGAGHHDGAIEPTLAQLRDGRIWVLIRTNLGRFWSAWSEDGGLNLREMAPSPIEASSSPAFLKRLASGRLLLVWNPAQPPDGTPPPMHGGLERPGEAQYSETEVSWYREGAYIALSDDDGQTWSQPLLFVEHKGRRVSYPYVFEPWPGEIWVWLRQSGNPGETSSLTVSVMERDLARMVGMAPEEAETEQ